MDTAERPRCPVPRPMRVETGVVPGVQVTPAETAVSEPRTKPATPPVPRRHFERLGLRSNPFCVLDVPEILSALLSAEIWERASAWLDEDTQVIEFVGQRGWGKSTHMRVVEELLRRRGLSRAWTYVQLGQRAVDVPTSRPNVWFIDEADRLKSSQRSRVLKLASRDELRVVIGTHVSLVGECVRRGARCRSVALAAAAEADVTRFLEVRVRAAKLPTAPECCAPQLTGDAVRALCQWSRGSLREIEALLYEVFQRYADDGAFPTKISERDIIRAAEIVRQSTRTTPGTRDD